MKTNSFFTKKISIYSLLGFFALIVTSCGSYQNSSYYDNDGVYGSNEKPKQKEESKSNNGYYKEYFSNLNKDNEQVFTDVNKYSSYNDTIKKNGNINNNVNQNQSDYAGWGSNPDNVTVNVYGNNMGWNNFGYYGSNWGYGSGYYGNYWGWNSGWYGPSWGWNSWYGPSWGWGWNSWYGPSWYGNYGYGCYGNNWGWNYGHLGHNYAYSGGRRNSNFIGNEFGNYSGRRSSSVTGVPRSYNNSVAPRSSANYNTRNYNNTPRANYSNQNYNNTPRNYNSNSTPRNYNNNTNSSTRSYTPSSSSPRSYGGGGGSYGGGGGGRSGGGGGRR